MRACSSGDRYPGPPWPASPPARPGPSAATSPSTARSTGRCAPIADTSSSTCTTVVSGPISRAVAHRPHVERAAPADDQVGRADQLGRERRGEAAAHIEVPGIAAEQALGRGRGGEQRPARVGEPLQVGPGVRHPGAPPGDEHRPLRAGQDAGQLGRRLRPGRAGAQRRRRRDHRRVTLRRLDVERHREHHRAALCLRGPVGPGHVGGGRAGRVQPVGLRPDRGGERGHVDPEVGPHRRAGHVGRQHQQRRAALGRLGDAGERVGQARPLMDRHQADPAGRPRPAVGHAGGAALVAGGDEPGAPGDQGVGHVEVAAAHHAEHRVGAEAGEHRPGRLADQHRGRPLRPVRPGRAPGTGCPSRR